jgi:hypothetical protein
MIASAFIALASTYAYAAPVQYREIKLSDGREIVAQVVETRPEGMWIRVPQGERLVPFTELGGMQPSDESAYLGQAQWPVAIAASPALLPDVLTALNHIDGLEVWTVGVGWPASNLGIDQQAQAAVCGRDMNCLVESIGSEPPRWVLTIEQEDDGVRIDSTWTGGPYRASQSLDVTGPGPIWRGLLAAIELDNSGPLPKSLASSSRVTQKASRPATQNVPKVPREAVSASAGDRYVPVPGYVAMKKRDKKGTLTALAISLPATAAWIALTGSHAQSIGSHAALGVIGFSTIAITSNHLFGIESGGPASVAVASD